MRTLLLAAAMAAAASSPAFARSDAAPPASHKLHHKTGAATGETPIDKGPNTPEANRAYQGGGVVLEGQPGAPAPTPQPTPPGQTPRGAVPR